jgi:hypothetical protein
MEATMVLVIVLSFAAGVGLRLRLTVVIGPVLALIVGALSIDGEVASYDMHGLGYAVGGVGAILSLIVWLLGRWVRNLPPTRDPGGI